ncbi:thiolase family protein [Membranihabitans marinus]|uniref:thiolase family protein n=1 Tax=Membranihabitans marinus TaxID=1227546 RepID=UPI001F369085|nr:thiolase family protein [Membranihabitans marinus]
MEKVYILSATRTAIGSFGGVFKDISAVQLGGIAIEGAISQALISHTSVEEVFMGNVLSANLGQAPAKQAALKAGIPHSVPCTLVNKVCASGIKSIMLAAQSIQLGQNHVAVAGGMENMSSAPYYVPQARFGYKFGSNQFVDGLEKDGLQDAYNQNAMGVFADNTAEKYKISRAEQDDFAIASYQKVDQTTQAGIFKEEITPVKVPQRKGPELVIDEDEEFKRVRYDKIPQLRAAFSKDGTVTAANASTINDGASALVLASESFVRSHGLTPIAEILSYADASQAPEWFTTSPIPAAQKALERAGLKNDDIDLFEVNEAFAVVPMVFGKEQGIHSQKINIHGGAVAMGHPLGASGARIVTTLINALGATKTDLGCSAICNGGGGASALIIRKL